MGLNLVPVEQIKPQQKYIRIQKENPKFKLTTVQFQM